MIQTVLTSVYCSCASRPLSRPPKPEDLNPPNRCHRPPSLHPHGRVNPAQACHSTVLRLASVTAWRGIRLSSPLACGPWILAALRTVPPIPAPHSNEERGPSDQGKANPRSHLQRSESGSGTHRQLVGNQSSGRCWFDTSGTVMRHETWATSKPFIGLIGVRP